MDTNLITISTNTTTASLGDTDPYGLSPQSYHGGAGVSIRGTSGDDFIEVPDLSSIRHYLRGHKGDDQLIAGINDDLYGSRGNDTLDGTRGSSNRLHGSPGDDVLLAGPSNRLNGGPGDDILFAGSGYSTLRGGSGDDQFWIVNGELPDGVNYIRDFGRDLDTIVIDSDGVNSFSDLNLVRRGRNTIIYIGTISVAVIWRNQALNEDDFLFVGDNTGPTIIAQLVNDTGVDQGDTITSDATISGVVTDSSEIISLTASLPSGDTVVEVKDNGSFTLVPGTLPDGDHSLTLSAEDAAGNLSQISVSFTLDTTAPTAIIASSLDTTSTVIEVSYSEAVSGLEVGNYTLTSGGEIVPVESVEEINSSLQQLNLGTRLNAGNYQLSITGVSDLAGNVLDDPVVLDFTVVGAPVEISPTSGEEMVSLNRNPVMRFGKKVDPTTVNENTFEIIANGERVAGRIAVSSTKEFATFFSDTALPASTSVRVTVVGKEIMGLDGVALDADGDGTPGGTLTADFSTLPLIKLMIQI